MEAQINGTNDCYCEHIQRGKAATKQDSYAYYGEESESAEADASVDEDPDVDASAHEEELEDSGGDADGVGRRGNVESKHTDEDGGGEEWQEDNW